ncbi:MAG: hypothetical protein Q9222_006764 [Ikaeria aurantiellina]
MDGFRKSGKKKTRKSNVLDDFQVTPKREESGESGDWGDSSTLEDDDSLAGRRQIHDDDKNRPSPTLIKAQSKRAKHCGSIQVITPDLMAAIAAALHPERLDQEHKPNRSDNHGNSSLSNRIIHDNISFNTNCFEPKSMRQNHRARKLLQANGIGKVPPPQDPQDDPYITFTLERLGIPHCPLHASKERNTLEKQLRIAVREDLEKVENEDQEIMMRMAGYWRYVNRKTYNFMVRQNQIWDWATGEKLEEVEDNDEDSLSREIDDDIDTMSWDDASTADAPSSGAISPLTAVDDYAGTCNANESNLGTLADIPEVDAVQDKRYEQLETIEDLAITPRAAQTIFTTFEQKVLKPPHDDERSLKPMPALLLSASKEAIDPLHPGLSTIAENAKTHTPTRPQGLNTFPPTAAQSNQDPNNRYTALGEKHEQVMCHLVHSKRALKLIPENTVALEELNGSWSTVKGKNAGSGGKMKKQQKNKKKG